MFNGFILLLSVMYPVNLSDLLRTSIPLQIFFGKKCEDKEKLKQ